MKLGFLKIGEKAIEKLGFRICAYGERGKGTSERRGRGQWRREPTLKTRERERETGNRRNKFSIRLC